MVKVIISGKGIFRGEKEASYEIRKSSENIELVSEEIQKTYGDSAFLLEASVKQGTLEYISDNEEVVTVDTDGKITINGAGSARITVFAAETDCYLQQEAEIRIMISPKPLPKEIMLTGTVYVYTGEAVTPKVALQGLVRGKDYQLTFANNINAADKEDKDAPTVCVMGMGNYIGVQNIPFTIEKAELDGIVSFPDFQVIHYGQILGDCMPVDAGGMAWFGDSTVNGVFEFLCPNEIPLVDAEIEYDILFRPESSNFKEKKVRAKITVSPYGAAPSLPDSKMEVPYSTDTVSKIVLPAGWQWMENDAVLSLIPGEEKEAKAVYNGSDKANYETITQSVTITRLADSYNSTDTTIVTDGTMQTTEKATEVATMQATERTTEASSIEVSKGTILPDVNTKAIYKVIKSGVSNAAVEYSKSTDTKRTSIVIPATVTINGVTYKVIQVAPNAFKDNKKVRKVTIGKNTTVIGAKAFYGCTNLTKVTIGKNVTNIGTMAFYSCKNLKSITIPAKVKKINKKAFYGCKNLKSITIKTKLLTAKSVGKNAFSGIFSQSTIKVPKSKFTSYKKILKAGGISSKAKIKK